MTEDLLQRIAALEAQMSRLQAPAAAETHAHAIHSEAKPPVLDQSLLAPLQPLLDDPSINDILINGPMNVFVEQQGKLVKTDVTFPSNLDVTRAAELIATQIGRTFDPKRPMLDARLPDGSRVNVIAPPLAVDGTSISIRKFAKFSIGLDQMATQGNVSQPLAELLKIVGKCRLNVMISGGTGSGKTTLLNAVSQYITDEERIVTAVGRRVDEMSPICDARLKDGSRVNVIAPPLSLKGCSISIRKFSKKKITLDVMASQNNISDQVCKLLKIAGACRLNLIISGGTGSGKTTLLNAMSRMIDHGERIVTIEDAAELQLQQPHVVPLETRPANLEGHGEISMRDLVKNALRMRPDRIILGEVRGGEAIDLLQAMNTGHDGSMGTLHANNPREALTRLENMVNMSGMKLPSHAIRHQISSAVQLIVQIQRMRDGMRRVTHVTEVVGMEGDVIITQDLYTFQFEGEDENGKLIGQFKSTGLRPNFTKQAAYFGLEKALLELM